MFGIQGAGKGTQAKLIHHDFPQYHIFETGAELRHIASQDSDLGREVNEVITKGGFVDNNLIFNLIRNFLQNVPENAPVIFDGFPRKEIQREGFEEIMAEFHRSPIGIHLELEEEHSINRLLNRFICAGVDTSDHPLITEAECLARGGNIVRRSDDNLESIKNRIDAFQKETTQAINWYRERNRLFDIPGHHSPHQVHAVIVEKLKLGAE